MHHRPLDAQEFPRFSGIRTYMRAPHTTDLAGVDAAVVGVPFDTATSYRSGARFGPEGIRSASALIRNYHPVLDVNVDVTSHGVSQSCVVDSITRLSPEEVAALPRSVTP